MSLFKLRKIISIFFLCKRNRKKYDTKIWYEALHISAYTYVTLTFSVESESPKLSMSVKGKKLLRSNRKVGELFRASVRLLVAPTDSFSRLVPTEWQVEKVGDDSRRFLPFARCNSLTASRCYFTYNLTRVRPINLPDRFSTGLHLAAS